MKPYLRVLAPAIIVATFSQPLLAGNENASPSVATENARPVQTGAISPLTLLAKGSDIVGLEVRNYQDQKLGKIQDLVVDVGAGRIVGLLVSGGGVFSSSDSAVMVPLAAFQYDAGRKLLTLENTKEGLKGTPAWEMKAWETFSRPELVAEVYRYYSVPAYPVNNATAPGVEGPGSSADRVDHGNRGSYEERTGHPEDNVDRRPEAHEGLTPADQGNNDLDLKTTARIRKDVLAQPDLSFGARNVKIITVNGRVTLRGTVSTEAERELIAKLAGAATQPGQVDNQIEIKAEAPAK